MSGDHSGRRLPGPDSTARAAARLYLERGYAIVPVPHRVKGPRVLGWPDLRFAEDEIDATFPDPSNIAILTGVASAGLIVVDHDVPEALQLAPQFLPPTGMIHGRRSKPRSNWWYVLTDRLDVKTLKFEGPDARTGAAVTIVEIRGTKAASTVPPSIHPSGEPYIWDAVGDPEAIGWYALNERVSRLAAASLLARYWQAGARHEMALALAGMLARAEW
jgi:Bifunctional DNA primase/polymerase, N-terminal